MSSVTQLMSLITAASMMLSGTLNAAAPQHDIDGLLFLANRQYTVSEAYAPADLEMSDVSGQVRRLRPAAAKALREMFDACKAETKKTLISVSGFRSYATQQGIYRRKLRSVKGSVERAQQYVAPPGASEHQLGLAMDIGQKSDPHLNASFGKTKGGIWTRENCWRFGFILRYNEGWESVTGYNYEPWHFRYVGKEYSKSIHDAGVPFETWLAEHRTALLTELIRSDRILRPQPPAEDPAQTPGAAPEADSKTEAESK